MKTILMKCLLSFFLMVLVDYAVNAQYICRGHGLNDIYFSGPTGYLSQALFRSTDNGSTISIQDSYNLMVDSIPVCGLIEPLATTTEGFLYCLDRMDAVSVSYDFGSTWTGADSSVYGSIDISGGEDPNKLFLLIHGMYPSIDYSIDSGKSFETINQGDFCCDVEVGTEPGELWALSGNISTYWILHSMNDGSTFDTIPVDHSIMGDPGPSFIRFSTGSQAGELFLATREYSEFPGYDSVRLYRSTDYAHSFERLHAELRDNLHGGFVFTAGRKPCSLYILDYQSSAIRTIYWIRYSEDCGSTFTTYDPVNTGLETPGSAEKASLTISPDPVADKAVIHYVQHSPGRAQLRLTDLSGHLLRVLLDEVKLQGNYDKDVNLDGLTPGFYLLQFVIDGKSVSTAKLIHQ